jgi:hypothetical protein
MKIDKRPGSLTVAEDGSVPLIGGHNVLTERDYFRVIKDKLFEAFYQRQAMQLVGSARGGIHHDTRIGRSFDCIGNRPTGR